MLKRSKALAASLLGATFLLGIAVGAVAMAAWDDDDGDRPSRSRERVSYSERLAEQLNLTPVQQESVTVILERRQEAMHGMWQQMHPRFDSLRVQIRNEILAVLDEEQQAAYQRLISRSDSARGDHGRRRSERR